MGHVECPQSEPANNDLQLGRSWMVATTNCSELGINRETVRRYLRLAKPAVSIAGSEEEADRKPAISITGEQAEATQSKPAISIAGVGAGAQELERVKGYHVGAWLDQHPGSRSDAEATPGGRPVALRFADDARGR